MVRPKRRYWDPTAMNDLLFNLLVAMTMLFFLIFLLVNPPDAGKDIESKAEFIITLEWEDHHPGDVDLWVFDPKGIAIGFSARESGITALERDDKGSITDLTKDQHGNDVYNPTNREIMTLRGIHAGEWVVNVHYYSSRVLPDSHPALNVYNYTQPAFVSPKKMPVEVTVRVIKLNPTYTVVKENIITLTRMGQEETAARFIVTPKGEIERMIDAPFQFVEADQ